VIVAGGPAAVEASREVLSPETRSAAPRCLVTRDVVRRCYGPGVVGSRILALLAATGAGAILGLGACRSNECSVGASRCSDENTREVCEPPPSGDVPLGGGTGGASWSSDRCPNDNPFCVVLSSGSIACMATPSRVPECDGGTNGQTLCVDQGLAGDIAGACEDGFVNASFVCLPPLSCATSAAGGVFCATGSGSDGGSDASPQGTDASDAAVEEPADVVGDAGLE
jgi:hypothetical protein